MLKILTPKDIYTVDYPKAIELAKAQSEIFWLPDEIEVEKDLHDLKTNFSESEYHGIISTLKLFTLYELRVGNDYWRDIVPKLFPRPDIQRMAATFSFMELGVHAPS
jgi:ribonucleotide reductase beta subunit family protein with ferritin-like domain